MTVRIFTTLAAILLVAAFGIAVIAPGMTLGEGLLDFDAGTLASLQSACRDLLPDGTWLHVVVPLLIRPAWLVPASLGIVCCGVAVNLNSSSKASPTRRHRS